MCGNSVEQSVKEQMKQNKSHYMQWLVLENTRSGRFGSRMPQVRVLSPRPNKKNPNFIIKDGVFGFFVYTKDYDLHINYKMPSVKQLNKNFELT